MTIKIGIYDHASGENMVCDASSEQIAAIEAERNKTETIKINAAVKAEADAIAKAALLDRLGITADEAALLLG